MIVTNFLPTINEFFFNNYTKIYADMKEKKRKEKKSSAMFLHRRKVRLLKFYPDIKKRI